MARMTAMIGSLKGVLDGTPGLRLAVLFGSAARRTAGSGRDLDVGVVLDHAADPSLGLDAGEPALTAISALAVALERATGRTVDLILLDDAPPLLRFEIARDGVVLLEHEPHAWATFRAHAMIDWWDWAPTASRMHESMAARLRAEVSHGPS
jgi:predicted nucleotidyltransferase